LAVWITGFLLGLIDGRLHLHAVGPYGPLGLAFVLLVLAPGLAVTIRRLHDTDHSGWWCLLRIFGYTLSLWGVTRGRGLAPPELGPSVSNVLISIFFLAFTVVVCLAIVFFVFLVSRGTEGPNRYGPDPYGPGELEQVFA
jgi:uncharacterized membrane protein YhaH (DUF805 family)